jgi:ribonuclease-3
MEPDLQACEASLGYRFGDSSLLRRALTHSSIKGPDQPSNERLEFLGDAVLGQIVSHALYERFPDFSEGQLTKIKSVVVSRRTLGRCSRRLGVDRFLAVGKGVTSNRSLPFSLLGDVFEAILAAVYLDGGYAEARDFVLRHLGDEVERVLENRHVKNYKSLLQHLVQRRFDTVPCYRVVEERGPDHSKSFHVRAVVEGRALGSAWGRSKKAAEQLAAKESYARLREEVRAAAEPDSPDSASRSSA